LKKPKSFIKLLGGFVAISFHFIPSAVIASAIPSRQFSVLENLTRRAFQEKPTRLDLKILMMKKGTGKNWATVATLLPAPNLF
jgi:hypothetical protein